MLIYQGKTGGEGIIRHVDEFYAVHGGNLGGTGFCIGLAVVNGFDAVGAEGLHARGAGHGGAGYNFGLAAFEEAAQVNFCMEHEFLAFLTGSPEALRCGKSGEKPIVGGTDDAVVFIQRGGADLAVGVFGSQGGHVGQCHDILRYGEAAHGIIIQHFCGNASVILFKHSSP